MSQEYEDALSRVEPILGQYEQMNFVRAYEKDGLDAALDLAVRGHKLSKEDRDIILKEAVDVDMDQHIFESFHVDLDEVYDNIYRDDEERAMFSDGMIFLKKFAERADAPFQFHFDTANKTVSFDDDKCRLQFESMHATSGKGFLKVIRDDLDNPKLFKSLDPNKKEGFRKVVNKAYLAYGRDVSMVKEFAKEAKEYFKSQDTADIILQFQSTMNEFKEKGFTKKDFQKFFERAASREFQRASSPSR